MKLRHRLVTRLTGLFAIMLVIFTLLLTLVFNAMMEKQMINHYSKTMQRDAYAISQNLSEMIAPSSYDSLDENPFIVGEDTLAPYMALIEHITHCNAYLIDEQHHVTGYFDGVVQTIGSPLLPSYIEQTIALGFMGKTPFLMMKEDGDTHLTTGMPIMNAHSHVLGVVLLETTLRELGFAQVSSTGILAFSGVIAFVFALGLSFFFSRFFTKPITEVQHFAGALAQGQYEARIRTNKRDEIGMLYGSMDILAQRLEEARQKDELLKQQQQTFFATVSHELKTPVTVIRGSVEALRDGVISSPDDVRAYYNQILTETKGLQRLISELLELSRLQNVGFSLDMGGVDLRELLGDVAMSTGALCERKGVVFVCEEPKAGIIIRGDYRRLRQMLLAVADNAVKFTEQGKTVTLSLEGRTVIIADEGAGIAQEELPHIFDRFHRAHGRMGGTGLGLAIASEVAKRHHIVIDVESRMGQGTTFKFTFPMKNGKSKTDFQ